VRKIGDTKIGEMIAEAMQKVGTSVLRGSMRHCS
jgi:hypothetical protein